MYGHLRLPGNAPPQLRALQQAQMCAACHALHEFAGRPAALLTNHDAALLLLTTAVAGPGTAIETPVARRCTALPFRTVAVQPLSPALRAFVAAGSLVLAKAKLADDADDGGGWLARLGRAVLGRPARRAATRLAALGFPITRLAALRARQRAVERDPAASIADLAAPTADLLAQVFAHGAMLGERGADAAAFAAFGHAVGRIVYGTDALVDQTADARRGRFNAVAALATRHGAAAPALVREFVVAAATAARAPMAGCLEPERAAILAATLDNTVRAAAAAAGPADAARSAEAGVCDLACDVGACEVGECAGCGGDAALCCDPPWCWRGSKHPTDRAPRPQPDRGAARTVERDLELLRGHSGTTLTDLAPTGVIQLGALEHEASAKSGSIPAGKPVRVVGTQGTRLVVELDEALPRDGRAVRGPQ